MIQTSSFRVTRLRVNSNGSDSEGITLFDTMKRFVDRVRGIGLTCGLFFVAKKNRLVGESERTMCEDAEIDVANAIRARLSKTALSNW